MKSYAFGIDLGGTTVKIGLFDPQGTILEKWEIPTDKSNNGANVLSDIAASVLGKMKEKGIGADQVEGVGIDVPGPVLNETVVNRCVNIGWGVIDVGKELSEKLGGLTVKVGNDANVAALGEMWKGGGQGHQNVVMATLGTGVGGGIILNGKIVPGTFGAAGEIGHMCMNPNETAVCGCGKKGHLEQYASATGITRMANDYLASYTGESSLKNIADPSAKDIFDAAKAGDQAALDLVDKLGDMLGRAFALISCVVDPEVYVIGGGVSKAGQILIDVTEKYYKKYAFHASENAKITLATLGNDAGIYGAVRQVL
jgi:glucokinase